MNRRRLIPLASATIFLSLISPGCFVFVVGAAAAAGGLLAVNLTQDDTIESRMSGLDEDRVYTAALGILKKHGTVEKEHEQSRWAEGKYDGCRLHVSVRIEEDAIVLKVKARSLIEMVPSPNTAQAFQQRVFEALDLEPGPTLRTQTENDENEDEPESP